MSNLWNTFEDDREMLDKQYVKAWNNEESFERVENLKNRVMELADTLKGESHPVIKAKCFDYILENAPIYINPYDWFGIALEAQKMTPILDVGCPPQRILSSLSSKWQSELDEKLNLPEDLHFAKNARGYLLNEFYIDYNHSTPNWEDILEYGISGLLKRVNQYKTNLCKNAPLSDEQIAYFDGIEITYKSVLKVFKRYVLALKKRTEPKMQYMKKAFENLINNPPQNTYEALLLAWQYWFLQEDIDCVRVRTMGGLDQLYYQFYKNDLENGTFTKENIEELFVYFMNEFNAIRVHYQEPMYLGGMNESGDCIVNELSYIVLDAYNVLSAPNPKLQAKIGKNTPDKFLKAVLETIRNGNSSISIMNDDNAALSLMKLGVPESEALTNLMSGCWDYTVKNHEVKTIPVRVSLAKILEYTMTNGRCLSTNEIVGCETGNNFETFEDFYSAYEKQWLYIWKRVKSIIENWELYLADISPSNMFSGTMTDSLEQGVDGYARGMKYNTTVYTVAGLGTLVDSLCAIKKYVFDKKEISLEEFVDILKSNWSSNERLRKIILNDKDKYGNGSGMADELMVRLTDFFAKSINGVPNSRGGYWKLGTLSIDKNVRYGSVTKATPDGRKEGEPFSKNLSPVIGMDRGGITTLLNSVGKIDFSQFPHAGMLDLILHPTAVSGDDGLEAFAGLVKAYFAKGGHSLQFNIFSAETLKEAQKNPDKYRTLQIRVCGWNVYFVDLEKVLQDAFIKQCEHYESF